MDLGWRGLSTLVWSWRGLSILLWRWLLNLLGRGLVNLWRGLDSLLSLLGLGLLGLSSCPILSPPLSLCHKLLVPDLLSLLLFLCQCKQM